MKRILIIQGHPDPDRSRLGYQLASAYKNSAEESGFEVDEIFIADLNFQLLRSENEFNDDEVPEVIRHQQQLIASADHLVIFYPLWLGSMPALLKGFIEQVFRPGFAFSKESEKFPEQLLKGKTARVIVTMGMPSFVYRWFFRAHSLKNLQRNILGFCGIHPVRTSLFGNVENMSKERYQGLLNKMRHLGGKAC